MRAMRPVPGAALAALALLLSAPACKDEPAAPPPKAETARIQRTTIDPSKGSLAEQLAAQAAEAAKRGLRPQAEIHAAWCEACQALDRHAADPALVKAFAGTWIVRVDYERWQDQLEAVGLATTAVPAFFTLDAAGKPTGARLDGSAWGEDVPAEMAPPLGAFFAAR
jgi:thiol:disulfide interchange protein